MKKDFLFVNEDAGETVRPTVTESDILAKFKVEISGKPYYVDDEEELIEIMNQMGLKKVETNS